MMMIVMMLHRRYRPTLSTSNVDRLRLVAGRKRRVSGSINGITINSISNFIRSRQEEEEESANYDSYRLFSSSTLQQQQQQQQQQQLFNSNPFHYYQLGSSSPICVIKRYFSSPIRNNNNADNIDTNNVFQEASNLIALFSNYTDDNNEQQQDEQQQQEQQRRSVVTKQYFDQIMNQLSKPQSTTSAKNNHDYYTDKRSSKRNRNRNRNRNRYNKNNHTNSDLCVQLLRILETAEIAALRPDIISYNHALQALAVEGKAAEAEQILQDLILKSTTTTTTTSVPSPTLSSFHTVIHAYARAPLNSIDTPGHHAERLFTQMEKATTTTTTTTESTIPSPNGRTLATVMDVWAQQSKKLRHQPRSASTPLVGASPAERLEIMLETVLDRYRKQKQDENPDSPNGTFPPPPPPTIRPNRYMFHSLIQAWGNYQNNNFDNSTQKIVGAEKAQEVLRMMERLSQEFPELCDDNHNFNNNIDDNDSNDNDNYDASSIQATTRTYALVLNAWAEECSRRHTTSSPSKDYTAANTAITTTTNNNSITDTTATAAAYQCRQLLEEMFDLYQQGQERFRPNAHCFAICIKALVASKNLLEAQEMWDDMVRLYRNRKQQHASDEEQLKPNLHAAGTLIRGWANSKTTTTTSTLLITLKQQQQQQQQQQPQISTKDVIAYVGGIVDVLNEFDVKLNTETLNAILNFYAKHDYTMKAQVLLESMESEGIADVVSYNTVMNALSNNLSSKKTGKKDNSRDALYLLDQIEEKAASSSAIQPDKFTYTPVIKTISKSMSIDKAQQSKDILDRMIKMGCKPDVVAFTAVLNACANTSVVSLSASPQQVKKYRFHQREALKIALETFETMRSMSAAGNHSAKPNQRTYIELFKACTILSHKPQERIRLLENVFQKCCDDGMLGKLGMLIFCNTRKGGVPRDIQEKYGLGHNQNDGNNNNNTDNDNIVPGVVIPTAWCCNVPKHDRPNHR